MQDGATLSQQVDATKGGDMVPLTADELHAKFRECACQVVSRRPPTS